MVVRRRGVDLTTRATLVTEQAAAKLAKRGMEASPRPVLGIPVMPVLTELDDESLMGLFGELVAWADYVGTQLAYAVIDERAMNDVLTVSEATAMVSGWSAVAGDKVTIARAQRDLDEGVQEIKQAATEAYAVRKLTETLFNNLERDASLVSRELTRRTAGQAPAQRSNRMRA